MRRRRALVLGALALGLALVARHVQAQTRPAVPTVVPTPRPPVALPDTAPRPRADTLRTRSDSARARTDSARARGDRATAPRPDSSLVQWVDEDSVAAALRARPGYNAVRYQGDTVRFLARQKVLTLRGVPAAVERGQTLLVGRTVRYDDSLQVVTALADTTRPDSVVLRDPSQGSDVIVRGSIRYDLNEQRGLVSGFSTAVEQGQTWFVRGGVGAVVSDTSQAARTAESAGNGRPNGVPGARPDSAAQRTQAQRTFYAHDASVTSCDEAEPHYHFVARDIKVVSKRILVIRPAVLYIGDVPVMWLPFVFQDTRPGRRSGLLRPQFGVAELLRNSPSYQRSVTNLGYYTTLGNYADFRGWLDFHSGARPVNGRVGSLTFNAESRYKWIDRFIDGQIAASYLRQTDGGKTFNVSWQHDQRFNVNRSFKADINFAQNTTVNRRNLFNPNAVAGTIRSNANFTDKYGPFSLSLGGSGQQRNGQPDRMISFPSLNVTSLTIPVTPWLEWTPTLSVQNDQSFRLSQGIQFAQLYRPNAAGGIDSTTIRASRRNSNARFDTPIKLFNFQLQNSFNFTERVDNFPTSLDFYRTEADTSRVEKRVVPQYYESGFDWNTSFSLPQLLQGTWNVSPSIGVSNVASGAYLIRTVFSNGRWIAQRKRLNYGISASPTFYAFAPGIFGVERFRHSISPTIIYSYSPAAKVSDEFLTAANIRRQGYLGSLVQNRISLGLVTNLEAKLRAKPAAPVAAPSPTADGALAPRADTLARAATALGAGPVPNAPVIPTSGGSANDEGRKIKVVSLNFSTVSYDFARADSTGRGFVTPTFGINGTSDLLPGFSANVQYELFAGNPESDTARFKPYRTSYGVSFQLDRNSAVFGALSHLFGIRGGAPTTLVNSPTQGSADAVPGGDPTFGERAIASRAAGSGNNDLRFAPPPQHWQASFNFTSNRQRPPFRGSLVAFDPAQFCSQYLNLGDANQLYDNCYRTQLQNPSAALDSARGGPIRGGVQYAIPETKSLNSNTSFHITQKWSAQWSTNYDLVRNEFASNQVSLQRELHDWRANFYVTQSPNGNFAFSFSISLKAEPDLKFDFNRQTVRGSQF